MELAKRDGLLQVRGMSVAAYNAPDTPLSAAEIMLLRHEPINEANFKAAMVLFCERFNREISQPLMRYYYQLLGEEMGDAEFRAACRDAMKAELLWQNLVPFLLAHVRKQREEGPDLWLKQLTESHE